MLRILATADRKPLKYTEMLGLCRSVESVFSERSERSGMHIDWGDAPTWVAAIGTIGTLVAALFQIGSERLSRKKLEQQKQATEISTWIGDTASPQSTRVVIQNMSGAPIYDVVLTLVIASGTGPQTGEEMAKLSD